MKKTLIAVVLLAVSGSAYAGELETQRTAGELSLKMFSVLPAANTSVPQPGQVNAPPPATAKSAAANYYGTACYMKNGDTVGIIYNRSREVLHYSGTVRYRYYDKYGEMLDTEWSIEMGMVWGGETDTITESGYPDDAAFCALDAREAVTSDHVLIGNYPWDMPGNMAIKSLAEEKNYGTSCRIVDGEAVGVVRNLSGEVFRYSGSVSFYFYDSKDSMVDENLSMESGTIAAYDSKIIKNIGIPLRAVSCGMDISAAVRK